MGGIELSRTEGGFRRAAATVRRHLWVGSRPIWITSIVLALLTWPMGIGFPGGGLDFSWIGGLYMAVQEGKHFGTEVIFTYGPLGFLDWPQLWFGSLAVLAYLYFCVIYVSLTVVLTWSLSRTVGLLAAAVIVFISYMAVGFLGELPLLLAVGLSFAAMRANRPDAAVWALVVGGGLLCGIEPLVKLSVGPPTVLIIVLGLIGARIGRRRWGIFAATAIVAFFAAWFLTGQSIGNLWDYAVNGLQIITGYNEAMGYEAAETWEAVAIVVFALGLVGIIHRARFRDVLARWLATAVTLVAAYTVFKYGTTQFAKGGPPVVALSTLLAIFMMAPWPRRRAGAFLATTAIAGAIVLHAFPATANLDVLPKLETFKLSAELAIRPGFRHQYMDSTRASLQSSLAVPAGILEAVEGRTVAIEPWEIAVAWAYDLKWKPLPVFQNYSAYTKRLDHLNAVTLAGPEGPQMLIRQMPAGTVEGGGRPGFMERQSAWDPPEQSLVALCNFVPILTEGAWQALTRIPDRCLSEELVATRAAEPGEAVEIPRAGRDEVVVMRVKGADVEGLEKLGSFFWQPNQRRYLLDGAHTYRLVPGTADDPTIVSFDRSLDGGVAMPELPPLHTIAVEGVGGLLEYAFYRIKLRPVKLVSDGVSAGGARGSA